MKNIYHGNKNRKIYFSCFLYNFKQKMKLFVPNGSYFNTAKPIDISISLKPESPHLRAWYLENPIIKPVMENGFTGSVALGGAVNFRNIFFNPHGHLTHTECLGHITKDIFSVNNVLDSYFFKAQLISVMPDEYWNEEYGVMDRVITLEQLERINIDDGVEALVIRTYPNPIEKKFINYSDTNPPYLSPESISFFNKHEIKHLLIDLPSVDRESDGGNLLFHHAFWGVPDNLNFVRTITELVYVDSIVPDGIYILELQTAPFENDATPSRPILYELFE
jgi:kynurenine formamidase